MKSKIIGFIALIVLIMLSSQFQTSHAFESKNEQIVGSVQTMNGNLFSISDVIKIDNEKDRIVGFTVTYRNNNNVELKIIDYWVKVINKHGAQYTVHIVPDDKEKNSVAPKSELEIRYYVKVDGNTDVHDLTFRIIQWDFSNSTFERTLGTIVIPEGYYQETPIHSSKNIKYGNNTLEASIRNSSMNQNDLQTSIHISYTIRNVGIRAVKPSQVGYQLLTNEGYTYPLQAVGWNEDTSVLPQEKKDIQLTGVIPVGIQLDNLRLVVVQNISNPSVTYPLAIFNVPNLTRQDISIGKEYPFTTMAGSYSAILQNLYRLPWEENDILTAQIQIKNPGQVTLPVPSLSAYIKLDDNIQIPAEVIMLDKVIGIQPQKQITAYVNAKIPYTYQFSSVKLYVQEKKSSSGNAQATHSELIQFLHTAEWMSPPVINVKEAYRDTTIGQRSEWTVNNLRTYQGKSTDLIAATVTMTNLELRMIQVGKRTAHFTNPDGYVVPANIEEIKGKIMPAGFAQFHVWATVPKTLSPSGFSLLIGDTTNGTDNKSNGYINAVQYELKYDEQKAQDNYKQIDLSPYKLTLSRIGTQVDFSVNRFDLTFNYELERDSLIEANTEKRKVILEFKDLKDTFSYTQELTLDAVSSGQQLSSTNFELGSHSKRFSATDRNLYKIESLREYKLNIYEQIADGHRRLVASKILPWFIISE